MKLVAGKCCIAVIREARTGIEPFNAVEAHKIGEALRLELHLARTFTAIPRRRHILKIVGMRR